MIYSVKEIQTLPIGEKFGGIEKTIKTTKKTAQVGKDWIQSVVLTDTTGDMLADINLGAKYNPFPRGELIKIAVAIVQSTVAKDGTSIKKLYIDQWAKPKGRTADEIFGEIDYEEQMAEQIVRSKIKCLLLAAKVRTGLNLDKLVEWANDPKMKDLIDSIMKG